MKRRPQRITAIVPLLILSLLASLGIAVSPAQATASKATFKPVKRTGHAIYFAPRTKRADAVRSATVRLHNWRTGANRVRRVSVTRVRAAAKRRTRLRVKSPRRVAGRLKIKITHSGNADGAGGGPGGENCDVGAFSGLNPPSACWRPYAETSPFNREVPANPRLLSNSTAIVDRLVGWGDVQDLTAGHSESNGDWWHPIYYAQPGDPLYTVKCTRWVSSCEVHGDLVPIPAKAKPASAGDGHMTVIDQTSGVEYDFWQVHSKPAGGGTLEISHGGKTLIGGDGLGSNATAAHFGLAAGIIRGEEMLAGEINHALFSQIKCSSGEAVYPAAPGTSAAPCTTFGLSNKDAPPLGSRLWLAMSEAQINALAVPPWKKTILRAMANYGVIIGDTMNGNSSWGIQAESGASYTSFGAKDPWDTVGEQAGAPPYSGGFVFDVDKGIDWGRYLRVLDPCVSKGTC